MTQQTVVLGSIDTPWGSFGAVLTDHGLARLTFPAQSLDERDRWVRRWMPSSTIVRDDQSLAPLAADLNAYLAGRLRQFTIPVDLRGTPFQVEVWHSLTTIPFGQTRSYAEIAAAIGRPTAVRAVGAANGANPVPLVVPCHRVIGRDGTLTGYAGGLDQKRKLLALEGLAAAFFYGRPRGIRF